MSPAPAPGAAEPAGPASRRALLRGGVTLGLAAALSAAAAADAQPGPDPAPDSDPDPDSGRGPRPEPGSSRSAAAPGGGVFRPRFPVFGLVTNEYAYQHPHAADARTDPDWSVTSGSLFGVLGTGWSGVPDGLSPGPASEIRTGSSVLRIVTRRRDFGDVTVRSRVLLQRPGTTARTPATDWDGGHLWLRYRSAQELYALSFCRRDGAVVIKRKAPPPGGPPDAQGAYTTLAHTRRPLGYDTWHLVTGRAVTTSANTVRLSLCVDGQCVLRTEDPLPGRLTLPGGVGLRGDNTLLFFRQFTAAPGGRGSVSAPDLPFVPPLPSAPPLPGG